MNVLQQRPSFNSSVASSHFDASENGETVKLKNYAKELLKSRIFLGRYVERRFINNSVGYRDIVVVSPAEVDLKKDLLEVQYRLGTALDIQWIGITETDVIGCGSAGNVCLCTEIDNQPFGAFWFQIKNLKFREEEVVVALKCLRHISDAFLELEPMLTGGTKKIIDNADITTVASDTLNETYTEIKNTLKSALSIRNMKEFFTFLFAFVIAIFTGSTAFINFLGNFVLALIRELSILIKNSTPMFLGVLDFFSKIVGGFYILLAMFFKPNVPVRTSSRTVARYDPMPRHSVYYDDKQFD